MKRIDTSTKKIGRRVLKIVVKYFNGMNANEQADVVTKMFHVSQWQAMDSDDGREKSKALTKKEFGVLLTKFMKSSKTYVQGSINPITGELE